MDVIKLKLFLRTALLALVLFSGCQPDTEKVSTNSKSVVKKTAAGNLQRLAGTWISRSHNGFVLLRINPNSTGTFTWYNDPAKGPRSNYPSSHYSFGESPVKIRYRPQTGPIRYVPNIEVQIWVNSARHDYELTGDTLSEIDKMGYQGSLIRLHSKDANQ